jgi:hypothetical protein
VRKSVKRSIYIICGLTVAAGTIIYFFAKPAIRHRALGGPMAIVETALLEKGYVGIDYESIPTEQRAPSGLDAGVVVTEVFEGSPADSSGIAVGDFLVKADSAPLTYRDDLRTISAIWKPGQLVRLTIARMSSDGLTERVVEARLIGYDEMRRLRAQPSMNGLKRESP